MNKIIKTFFALPVLNTRSPILWLMTGIILAIVFIMLSGIHNKFIYTFGFTDEGDNISIGYYVLQDKKLYSDIFSQHQPLTYYISAGIQSVVEPDNILLSVRRHRQAVMVFSFLWILFLTVRFGLKLLPFLVILELMKYYYLGHLFLAESLVVYPCIYLFSVFWKTQAGEKLLLFEAAAISLCMFFIVFNLMPVAAALALLMVYFFFSTRSDKKIWLALIIPGGIATLVLFLVTPFFDYIDSAIIANIKYYIPNDTSIAFQVDQSKHQGLITMVFQPFIYLFQDSLSTFSVLQMLLSVTWVGFIWVYVTSSFKKIVPLFLVYLLLIIINSRPTIGSSIYYHAFHSLPYYAMFLASIGWICIAAMSEVKNYRLKILPFLPFVLFAILFFTSKNVYVNEDHSQEQTSYINFSTIYTYNDIVKTLASPGDTLAVIPYEELLYWNSGTVPPTRFLFYEAWPMDVPKYKEEILSGLESSPPTFIYWPKGNLKKFVDESLYVSVPKHDATISALFIRKDKAETVSNDQWSAIDRHLFKKPVLNN
jgi:hypothetical protein